MSHDVTTINRISAVLLTVSALFGLTAGWCISAFAGYPLNKLQAYMQKLSRLDLDGIPGLRSRSLTKLSSLREVSQHSLAALVLFLCLAGANKSRRWVVLKSTSS